MHVLLYLIFEKKLSTYTFREGYKKRFTVAYMHEVMIDEM